MSCFQCSTSALTFNEVILPLSFTLFYLIFCFYRIKSILKLTERTDISRRSNILKYLFSSPYCLFLFYILGLWICLQIGSLDIMDANIYSDTI